MNDEQTIVREPVVDHKHFADLDIRVTTQVSIIIVNYNGADYIGECLKSLLLHAPGDTEIIVVDNASQDGSVEYLQTNFPSVRVVISPDNGGYGDGNNLGVQHAIGKYLAFINPDTRVESDWVKPLIDALEEDQQAGIATAKILLLHNPQKINTCGNDMHYTGLTLCRGMGADASEFSEAMEVSAASGAAFVMRRELFESVGGFDKSLFMYMDDTDLSFRVRQAGYKCLYVPTSVLYHDYTLHFGPRKTYFQERNRYVMLLKTLQWRTFIVQLIPLLLAEMITWAFVLVRERRNFRNKTDAYYWVIKHWSNIMVERARVQSRRRVSDHELIRGCGYKMEFDQTGRDSVTRAASMVFDPIFYLLYRLSLMIIRW